MTPKTSPGKRALSGRGGFLETEDTGDGRWGWEVGQHRGQDLEARKKPGGVLRGPRGLGWEGLRQDGPKWLSKWPALPSLTPASPGGPSSCAGSLEPWSWRLSLKGAVMPDDVLGKVWPCGGADRSGLSSTAGPQSRCTSPAFSPSRRVFPPTSRPQGGGRPCTVRPSLPSVQAGAAPRAARCPRGRKVSP